jgi:hypothetical protein
MVFLEYQAKMKDKPLILLAIEKEIIQVVWEESFCRSSDIYTQDSPIHSKGIILEKIIFLAGYHNE